MKFFAISLQPLIHESTVSPVYLSYSSLCSSRPAGFVLTSFKYLNSLFHLSSFYQLFHRGTPPPSTEHQKFSSCSCFLCSYQFWTFHEDSIPSLLHGLEGAWVQLLLSLSPQMFIYLCNHFSEHSHSRLFVIAEIITTS